MNLSPGGFQTVMIADAGAAAFRAVLFTVPIAVVIGLSPNRPPFPGRGRALFLLSAVLSSHGRRSTSAWDDRHRTKAILLMLEVPDIESSPASSSATFSRSPYGRSSGVPLPPLNYTPAPSHREATGGTRVRMSPCSGWTIAILVPQFLWRSPYAVTIQGDDDRQFRRHLRL